MKYNGIEYLFDIDKVTDIWISFADNIALNENKEISVNVMKANGKRKPISRDFPSGNKIVCILERVEDGLNYLNSYELKQDFTYNNAFNFIEFLNCIYTIIHCIDELAKIFQVKTGEITSAYDCFSQFDYGEGCDKEVFEYIRSLCAVHPAETSRHPTVHKWEQFDCCSRIVWDKSIVDERDLTAVVYTSESIGDPVYVGIKVEPFIKYLYKWLALFDPIKVAVDSFADKEKIRFRKEIIQRPDQFDSYVDYIDNLKKEYQRRIGTSHIEYFDYYRLAFEVVFDDEEIEKKKKYYQHAVKYMFWHLHRQLQEMEERKYTGIKDLAENDYTTLFYELYMPIEGNSRFSNDRGAFKYIDNLNSSVGYDVVYARQVLEDLKPLVNDYIKFTNDEPKEHSRLIFQIATYLDALYQNGYINSSIPNLFLFRDISLLLEDKNRYTDKCG